MSILRQIECGKASNLANEEIPEAQSQGVHRAFYTDSVASGSLGGYMPQLKIPNNVIRGLCHRRSCYAARVLIA